MSHRTGCLPCQEGSGRLRSLHQHAHDWLGNRWSGLAYLGSGWSALRPLLLLLGHSTFVQESIVYRSDCLIYSGLLLTMICMFFGLTIALLLLCSTGPVESRSLKLPQVATWYVEGLLQMISESSLGLIGFPQPISRHSRSVFSARLWACATGLSHGAWSLLRSLLGTPDGPEPGGEDLIAGDADICWIPSNNVELDITNQTENLRIFAFEDIFPNLSDEGLEMSRICVCFPAPLHSSPPPPTASTASAWLACATQHCALCPALMPKKKCQTRKHVRVYK